MREFNVVGAISWVRGKRNDRKMIEKSEASTYPAHEHVTDHGATSAESEIAGLRPAVRFLEQFYALAVHIRVALRTEHPKTY